MALDIDCFSGLDSPLHRLEPRCRLLGLGALIAAFALVHQPILLVPMIVVSGLLLVLSRLPFGFVAARLRLPGLFVLVVGVLLPFTSGSTVLWRLGPLDLRLEGLQQMVVILAKLVAIVSTGLVLLGTAPLPVSVSAMRRLGLPALLADMTVFSYRYIHEIGADLRSMRAAAGLRGFRWRRRGLGAPPLLSVLATLVGSLFVSSHFRAEQVHRAMVLRGYSLATPMVAVDPPGAASIVAAGLLALLGACFVVAEWLLQTGVG